MNAAQKKYFADRESELRTTFGNAQEKLWKYTLLENLALSDHMDSRIDVALATMREAVAELNQLLALKYEMEIRDGD